MVNFFNSLNTSDILTVTGIIVTIISMIVGIRYSNITTKKPDKTSSTSKLKTKFVRKQAKKFRLLPYLPDLDKQEEELGEMIQMANSTNIEYEEHLPLLCLISRDVDKDIDLTERFKMYFAYQLNHLKAIKGDIENTQNKILEKLYFNHNQIKPISLCETDNNCFHTMNNLHEEIWQRLRDSVCINCGQNDWKTAVAKKLAGEPRPIFIHITIEMMYWQNNVDDFIKQFILFWYDKNNNWTNIIVQNKILFKYPLVICLFFNHQTENTAKQKWFWKNRRLPKLPKNLDYRSFLEKYKAFGVILPALSGINEKEVQAWAETYEDTIRNRCHCRFHIVQDEISRLYSNKETIPMKTLCEELKRILIES